MRRQSYNHGFTLIELSIVLVIIGLIVGGVLVGRDLIKASELNSIITQTQKYKLAINAFKLKYNSLPGDIDAKKAASLGLFECTWSGICGVVANGTEVGGENEDGTIYMGLPQNGIGGGSCEFECAMFWRHLSQTHLIEGDYGADLDWQAIPASKNGSGFNILSKYNPPAKWGGGVYYFSVASSHWTGFNDYIPGNNLVFYFLRQGSATQYSMTPSMTPAELYSLDKKIDDGKPASGSVLAEIWGYYLDSNEYYDPSALSGKCAYGVTNNSQPSTFAAGEYNTSAATGGNVVSCLPLFSAK